MPQIYGFECLTCQTATPEYRDRCPACSGTMSAVYESPEMRQSEREAKAAFGSVVGRDQRAQRFQPVVYHQTKDGHISWPAHPDAPVRPGYVKQEARTIRELVTLERRMNRQELDKAEDHQHREEMQRAMALAEIRSDLASTVRRQSARARSIYDRARQLVDSRAPRVVDPGVHLEILNFDQGNRGDWCDRNTEWKRRRV